jgi:hypothetical protein
MADALDFLRNDVFLKRINPIVGSNRPIWSEKDQIKLFDKYMSARSEEIVSAALPPQVKLSPLEIDKAALAKFGIDLRSDIGPEDNPLVAISTPRTDLTNDDVDTSNVDSTDFAKFCQVLDTHDSSKPPVALSSRPWLSGTTMLAIARFPKPGVSADSDRISAAVRAGLQRGASIGFIPLKWSFSKDPSRPLGISFHAIKLLEWSFCALPCNQDCRVLGSVANNQSAPSDGKTADRRREARVLAAKARALCASIDDEPLAPPTREQRMAEARAVRRIVLAGEK